MAQRFLVWFLVPAVLCLSSLLAAAFESRSLDSVVSLLPLWPGHQRGGEAGTPPGSAPEASAVAVLPGGYLATALHTVDRASDIMVRLRDGRRLQASFVAFCGEWMKKLVVRERDNARQARPQSYASGVLIRYTGYAEEPRACEVRGSDSESAIGRIEYTEYVMQKWGPSTQAAWASRPELAARIEVIELFRHDGSRWQY